MRFAPLDHHFTGIALPVSALKTSGSCGCGDFSDLEALGAWCATVGLDLIQLLPVNDTGGNSSPYSALSAFALHPLYLRLQEVPGATLLADRVEAFRRECESRESREGGRFSYAQVRAFKTEMMEALYAQNASAIRNHVPFLQWLEKNPWVVSYAVFTAL
ncbi:MAG TPA: 4-alpha-glucanotransferase, partial [Spirochaetia bacterium]|nr:4-alpha-glucanotransferase [Spirochaetia bacterium]